MPGNSELAIGPLVVVPLSPLAYRRDGGSMTRIMLSKLSLMSHGRA